jgi:hypothetical protein
LIVERASPVIFATAAKTASTRAPHLCRSKQPPPALVEPRADRIPSQPNRSLVDHVTDRPAFAKNGNPWRLSQSDARAARCDSVIIRAVLKTTSHRRARRYYLYVANTNCQQAAATW